MCIYFWLFFFCKSDCSGIKKILGLTFLDLQGTENHFHSDQQKNENINFCISEQEISK